MSTFGTLSGWALPLGMRSRLLPGKRETSGEDYRILVHRRACDTLTNRFRRGLCNVPIFANHSPVQLGRVTLLEHRGAAGLYFRADIDDSDEGRLLPRFFEQRGIQFRDGVASGVPISCGITGDAILKAGDDGERLIEYELITELREISLLSGKRKGAFATTVATFSLQPRERAA